MKHTTPTLSPVHTSDNVAKNGDIVAETRDIVSKSRDIVDKNGNNIEGAVDVVPPEAEKNMLTYAHLYFAHNYQLLCVMYQCRRCR